MRGLRAALRAAWHKRYEFFRFTLANTFCNSVFFAILIGGVELFGWHYLIGSLVGFVGYTASQFILMRSFVYRSQELHATKALIRYVALLVVNQLLNMTLLWLLVDGVGESSMAAHMSVWVQRLSGFSVADYIVAQFAANMVSFIVNRNGSSKIFRTN